MNRRSDIDEHAAEVLNYLEAHSYEQTAARFGTSRGKVYNLAVEEKRRKNEARISEREADRKIRRAEFLTHVINSVMKADVLDYLEGLPDNAVDMHLTSVPYNLGKKYNGSETVDKRQFHYFLGWMLCVLSEMARTLRENGIIFLQVGSTKDDHGELYPLDCLLFEHLRSMNNLRFQSRIAWVISHGLTPRNRLSERYETALVMCKGDNPTFNPNVARTPQKQPDKRAFKGPNKGMLSGHPLGAHPSNVWTIPQVGHNHPDSRHGKHPAQFPLTLAKRAVMLYTLPGQLVCDPFSGSGTTAEACIQTGRAFTGADLFYEDMRNKRLMEAAPDLYFQFPGVTEQSLAVWEAEARPREFTANKALTKTHERTLFDEICAA